MKIRVLNIYNKLLYRGFQIKKQRLKRFDFSILNDICKETLIYFGNTPSNFKLKYNEFYGEYNSFENYLSSKKNTLFLYKKILPSSYVNTQSYINETERLSCKFIKTMQTRNKQLHAKSLNKKNNEKKQGRHARELLLANALSVIIEYKDKTMGILRFDFLDEKTSFEDQGFIITLLSVLSYSKFCQDHNNDSALNIDTFYHYDSTVKSIIKIILSRFHEIDKIMLFEEPGTGKVFHKREYQYSVNSFYMYTMHTGDGVDITRTFLVDSDLKNYKDLLFNEYCKNGHDKFISNIAYFNFTDFFLKNGDFDQLIPIDIYNETLDIINEYYFNTVTDQQNTMYVMIKEQVKDSFTSNIKSCHITKLKFAQNKLHKLEKSKRKDELKIQYIKKWIKTLKEKPKRLDPGSILLHDINNSDDPYDIYITEEFLSSIPWFNWEYTILYAHMSFKNRLGIERYIKHEKELSFLIQKIFGKNGYLYGNKKYSRGVFYQEIISQFEEYADWEKRKHQKGLSKISIDNILKDKVFKDIKNIAKWRGFIY